MKFEESKPEFRPVMITLETQEEVDLLHALVGLAGGPHANGLTYSLYQELDKLSDSNASDYWTGRLYTKD